MQDIQYHYEDITADGKDDGRRTSSSEDDSRNYEIASLIEEQAASRQGKQRNAFKNYLRYSMAALLWALSVAVTAIFVPSRCPVSNTFETGFDTELEPLRSAIEVEKVKFTGGLNFDENGTLYRVIEPGVPQYVGEPNPQIDAAWDSLLATDGVDLKGEEARTIAGKTIKKPDGGWWLVGIEGFHQLHCIRTIHRALHPDYYPRKETPHVSATHVDHCIDYLRQAVMCSLDITPITIEWTPKWNRLIHHFDAWHTCRNFDKIQSWVKQRSGLKHPLPPLGQPWPGMEGANPPAH